MRIGRNLLVGLLMLGILGVAETAHATPVLHLYSGGTLIKTIFDNDMADDLDSFVSGSIFFSGLIGDWDVMALYATSPLINGTGAMALGGVVMTSGAPSGSFWAYLSDDGFPTGPGVLTLSYGGSTDGSSSAMAQFGPLGSGYSTLSTSVMSAGFNQTVGYAHGSVGSDVMTIGLGFDATTSGFSSADLYVTNNPTVPEPMSLVLLGLGLVGVGALKRRNSR